MAKHHKHDSDRHKHGGNEAFREAMDARNERLKDSQRQAGMSAHFDAKSHSKTTPQGQRRAQRDRG
ncbi:hypothetical protein SRB5_13270 [Streptomyces sp. RB5]|uniref:Uncharacterized protein n=1 Tax=Streptomyces smaragdinus TaxID=2585196 RepID=A0A7K0CDQ9_9ACTN|nr:hypothetical protein [Streptomyces smaragdinus]MQY11212.1 hypothetical protein [Streptomyces smaragdinus]